MNNCHFLELANGSHAPLKSVPLTNMADFRAAVLDAVLNGHRRVMAFFPVLDAVRCGRLYVVLGNPAAHCFEILSVAVEQSYSCLTADAPAFHWFERELWEQTGIEPLGHPWLKPIRFTRTPSGRPVEPGVTDYFTMHGVAAHEVAVGPVHAGVIEPGHFRFQCMGEDVYSLEIELGYQHRGLENLLSGGPSPRTAHWIETAAGDTSVSSALCYAQMLESCSAEPVPPRAAALRVVALELERIANHVGDLGALAGDTAFLPTSSFCGRIRGEYLNMTASLCGNRFGRGCLVPGGVRYDLADADAAALLVWFRRTHVELNAALELMFDSPTVLDRLESTGTVSSKHAAEIGMVGVAGRASGLNCDARCDFPYCGYPHLEFLPVKWNTGDAFARAKIRKMELDYSHRMVEYLLENLPAGPVRSTASEFLPAPESIFVSVCEAWRGELCHTAITDAAGHFTKYKIVDPSFHNWFGLALALRGEQISNFPICNKSFNLSYCGHDL